MHTPSPIRPRLSLDPLPPRGFVFLLTCIAILTIAVAGCWR
jgi:hypothetical protein